MHELENILKKAVCGERIGYTEALRLYTEAPTEKLAETANLIRKRIKGDDRIVTWQIDRNVNITNVCVSGCKFCNFHCKPHQHELSYTTTKEEFYKKIEETLSLGGDQLLMQGGMHPKYGIEFYEDLFKSLKDRYPEIKLHALGPPEVAHISKLSGITYAEVLKRLIKAGLESFPGAGAEILQSEIRKKISPNKCSAEEWLEVMGEAHKLGLATSATMMYGHIEKPEDRIAHLIKIRDLQDKKPEGSYGFLAFIPWIYWGKGTALEKEGVQSDNSPITYLRTIAISRIILDNIDNIQASWLTMGKEVGILSLHAGANDLGSIMIEENVVSSAGASYSMGVEDMRNTIIEAGFIPRLRDQKYNFRQEIF